MCERGRAGGGRGAGRGKGSVRERVIFYFANRFSTTQRGVIIL